MDEIKDAMEDFRLKFDAFKVAMQKISSSDSGFLSAETGEMDYGPPNPEANISNVNLMN